MLALIAGSNFNCLLPSQSPKGASSPRGGAKGVCEFKSSSINRNLNGKSQFIEQKFVLAPVAEALDNQRLTDHIRKFIEDNQLL